MTNPLNGVVYRAGSRAVDCDARGRGRCVKTLSTRSSFAHRLHMQMIQPSPGCVFKSLSTLQSNDRIQNTQPPSYEIHRQRTPTHSLSPSLSSAENISCPHAASLNGSHWIPVSAIPSGQQIDIECVFRLRPSSC